MKEILSAMQAAHARRFQIAWTWLDKEKTVADSHIPFQEERADYDINYALFKTLLPQKDHIAKTAIVQDQDLLKDLIAEEMITMGAQVIAFAKKYKYNSLKKEYTFSRTHIEELGQLDVEPFITKLTDLLTPLLADTNFIKYKITAPDIKVITDNAALYNKNIGVSGATTNDVSTANIDINDTIALLTGNINQMALLNNYFKTKNYDFYNGFIKNTRKQYPAVHSTGICGIVYGKDNKPLANCQVRIIGTDKSAVTDAKGYYIIHGLLIGDFEVLASNEGGDSQTIQIVVRYRHTDTYDFHLV